jgi:hypothetical protein
MAKQARKWDVVCETVDEVSHKIVLCMIAHSVDWAKAQWIKQDNKNLILFTIPPTPDSELYYVHTQSLDTKEIYLSTRVMFKLEAEIYARQLNSFHENRRRFYWVENVAGVPEMQYRICSKSLLDGHEFEPGTQGYPIKEAARFAHDLNVRPDCKGIIHHWIEPIVEKVHKEGECGYDYQSLG